MNLSPVIAPSILSADFGNVSREIERIHQAGATWVQISLLVLLQWNLSVNRRGVFLILI